MILTRKNARGMISVTASIIEKTAAVVMAPKRGLCMAISRSSVKMAAPMATMMLLMKNAATIRSE